MPLNPAQLEFEFPAVVIPRQDGSYLVRPGKPVARSVEITSTQAAAILRCSIHTVYRYMHDGDITGLQKKPRGRILFIRAEVEALAGRQHPSHD